MPELLVNRVSPNPASRAGTTGGDLSNGQRAGEWVEFVNVTDRCLPLDDLALYHRRSGPECKGAAEEALTGFSGTLEPAHSIRVHTGTGDARQEGTIYHFYLGRADRVWNLTCGDCVILRDSERELVDYACYKPQPAEGSILHRELGTHQLD